MFLERLRRELSEAIQIGAALASAVVLTGCQARADDVPHDDEDDSDMVGSSSDEPKMPADAAPAVALDPTPAGMLGCYGPIHDGGYYGQCCFTQRCHDPAEGEECDELGLQVRPPGSGTCGCSVEERAALTGPFAPSPTVFPSAEEETYAPTSEGSCCYVVGSISCVGRPFVVSGAQRVAGPVWRSDWGLFA